MDAGGSWDQYAARLKESKHPSPHNAWGPHPPRQGSSSPTSEVLIPHVRGPHPPRQGSASLCPGHQPSSQHINPAGSGVSLIYQSNDGLMLRPVLLASRDGEQRGFGGRRDLDCNAPRVRWLRGKAEAQGSRPSKPEKKGTCPIGNSRRIAVRVGRLLSGSGKALDTFLCPLHELGLVKGERM